MSAEFIDSNVFIYALDEVHHQKRDVARQLIERSIKESSGVISHQVVQEVLNVMTTKMERPLTREDAGAFFDSVLRPLWSVYPTDALYMRALDLRGRYGYSFYDSLIIAAALDAGCSIVYSEDMQHNHTIDHLQIVDPFAAGS